ncbi:MAG: branched-chain amino acid ABC transporter substrate-binding protein, partial [Hyphomicrobium sp.]
TEGGVHGKRIKLVEADDGCNGEQGSLAAHSLIERDVVVVIGASAASAGVMVYASNNVVLLSMTRHPALTKKRAGETIFRVSGRNDRQGASAAAYLSRNFSGRPIAVVRDTSRYARRIANDANAALKEAGFSDILSAAIRGGQKDYAKLIAQLQAANTEVLFFAGFPLEAGLLLRQMRAAGLRTAFVGSDTLAPAQFADTAGSAATGARILLSHDPSRGPAGTGLKVKSNGRPPTGPFLTTLAAIEAWHAAVRKAGSIAPDAVSAALQEGTFKTVLGHISFTENGDSNLPPYDVVTWSMNAWRAID